MADQRFHVIFTGQIRAGAELATVKGNLARLFKMSTEKVDRLFSGKPVVLKKNVDKETAQKFEAVLTKAGAECALRPVTPEPVQAPLNESAPQARAEAEAESSPQGDLETVGTIRVGGTSFAGPFDVAEVGADMDSAEKAAPPPAPDVSHLSVAEAGAELVEKKQEQTPAAPDISHLSIEED